MASQALGAEPLRRSPPQPRFVMDITELLLEPRDGALRWRAVKTILDLYVFY